MERQMKKCRQTSPESTKVWMERSLKHENGKVQVVYYLCRNHNLEHPHFMEVPLSSPDGLYLKDVIDRLNFLRGRGMPAMYAWSCKRSYKNGFVWHDLCKDDLILPVNGNEYILKGSELVQESHSDLVHPGDNIDLQNAKQLQQPTMRIVVRETKPSVDEQLFPPHQCTSSSVMSPESRVGMDISHYTSKNLTEYNVYDGTEAADASTQTEEIVGRPRGEKCEDQGNQVSQTKEKSELFGDGICPLSASTTSSSGRTGTLESLMRADSCKMSSFRTLDKENIDPPSDTNYKSVNVLMQLISCGAVSAKGHSFRFIPSYRPRFSNSKLSSPLYSSSVMLGEVDYLPENPKLMGLTMDDKEYFSGSFIEKNTHNSEGCGCNALKCSSSFDADRSCKSSTPSGENVKETDSARLKCIPHSIKASLSKQLRRETMSSPASHGRRKSSADIDASQPIPLDILSNGSSKRTIETSSVKIPPETQDSFREEGKVIKIEENFLQELGL